MQAFDAVSDAKVSAVCELGVWSRGCSFDVLCAVVCIVCLEADQVEALRVGARRCVWLATCRSIGILSKMREMILDYPCFHYSHESIATL